MKKYIIKLNTKKYIFIGQNLKLVLQDFIQWYGKELLINSNNISIKIYNKKELINVNKELINEIITFLKTDIEIIDDSDIEIIDDSDIEIIDDSDVTVPEEALLLQAIQINDLETIKFIVENNDIKILPKYILLAKKFNFKNILNYFFQQKKCSEMKLICPDESKLEDPILYDNWCKEVSYKEYVHNDEFLSQCYKLSGLIQSFEDGLNAKRNEKPFPQWPLDPFTRKIIPPNKLKKLYEQSLKAGINISKLFFILIQNIDLFDFEEIKVGPYIGLSDRINIDYVNNFVIIFVDILKNIDEEELDIEIAIELSRYG